MCKILKGRFFVVSRSHFDLVAVIDHFCPVSQFTLLANTKKGTKPDFHGAMAPDQAKILYEYFFKKVQQGYNTDRVKDGVFQAMMEIALVNDGPVSRGLLQSSPDSNICRQVTLDLNTASPTQN